LEDGSLFTQLYSSDGSHPSLAGSYLTACVVFSTLTGQSTVGLADAVDLDAELRLSLQQAASSTVLEGSAGITYPWTVSDTGTQTDTASTTDDTSSEDTSSEDDKGTSDAGAASSACGCTTTPVVPTTLAWLGLLGGLASQRRAGSGEQVSPCGPPEDAAAHTLR
ncbi:MAG: hypothetical protein QGG40_20445, partial [Myxococcota bacterium]|nr:hypothetical protein [Myxococcota bacterium]